MKAEEGLFQRETEGPWEQMGTLEKEQRHYGSGCTCQHLAQKYVPSRSDSRVNRRVHEILILTL